MTHSHPPQPPQPPQPQHPQHHCSVCSDAADQAIVQELRGGDADVMLDSGQTTTIAVDLVPGVQVGDTVLVHQGVAISRIAAKEIVS